MNEQYNSISTYLSEKDNFNECVEYKTRAFLKYINSHAEKAHYLSSSEYISRYEFNCDQSDFETNKGPVLDFDPEDEEFKVVIWNNRIASLRYVKSDDGDDEDAYEGVSLEDVIRTSFENNTYEKLKENFDYSMNTLERKRDKFITRIESMKKFEI